MSGFRQLIIRFICPTCRSSLGCTLVGRDSRGQVINRCRACGDHFLQIRPCAFKKITLDEINQLSTLR